MPVIDAVDGATTGQGCEDKGSSDRFEVFEIAASIFFSSPTIDVVLVLGGVVADRSRSLYWCVAFSRSLLIASLREVGFSFWYNLEDIVCTPRSTRIC